jgi:hypothetical protein
MMIVALLSCHLSMLVNITVIYVVVRLLLADTIALATTGSQSGKRNMLLAAADCCRPAHAYLLSLCGTGICILTGHSQQIHVFAR